MVLWQQPDLLFTVLLTDITAVEAMLFDQYRGEGLVPELLEKFSNLLLGALIALLARDWLIIISSVLYRVTQKG